MTEGGLTFNEVAARYHRLRPRYPDDFFDRIGVVGGLAPGARVLELGAGTGIATRPLLERGWRVDAIEPGDAMIAEARRHLAGCPGVRFHDTTFEAWNLPPAPYDLVFSATAFHWIDRAVRYRKAHAALRAGGHLAVMQYRHVAGGDDALFDAIQDCYVAHMPGATRERLPSPAERMPTAKEMRQSGLFEVVDTQRLLEEVAYPRSDYLDLLSTYSGHRLLDGARRQRLLECIGGLIDRHGGVIRKAYVYELVIGRAALTGDG